MPGVRQAETQGRQKAVPITDIIIAIVGAMIAAMMVDWMKGKIEK